MSCAGHADPLGALAAYASSDMGSEDGSPRSAAREGRPSEAAAAPAALHSGENIAAVPTADTAGPAADTTAAAAAVAGAAASGQVLPDAVAQGPVARSRAGDAVAGDSVGAAGAPRGAGSPEPPPPGMEGRLQGTAEELQAAEEEHAAAAGGVTSPDALAAGGLPGEAGATTSGAALVEASSSATDSAVALVGVRPVEYGPALPPPAAMPPPVLRPSAPVMRAGLRLPPPAFAPAQPGPGGVPPPSAAAALAAVPSSTPGPSSTPEIVAIMDKLIEFIKARSSPRLDPGCCALKA